MKNVEKKRYLFLVKYLHSFNRQEHVLSASAATADGITNKANNSTATVAITCACCHCFMIFHISATENFTLSACKTPVYKHYLSMSIPKRNYERPVL